MNERQFWISYASFVVVTTFWLAMQGALKDIGTVGVGILVVAFVAVGLAMRQWWRGRRGEDQ